MSPKITISKGERVVEIVLTDEQAQLAAEFLNRGRTDVLVDPKTRRPYPASGETAEKIFTLGKELHNAGRK